MSTLTRVLSLAAAAGMALAVTACGDRDKQADAAATDAAMAPATDAMATVPATDAMAAPPATDAMAAPPATDAPADPATTPSPSY